MSIHTYSQFRPVHSNTANLKTFSVKCNCSQQSRAEYANYVSTQHSPWRAEVLELSCISFSHYFLSFTEVQAFIWVQSTRTTHSQMLSVFSLNHSLNRVHTVRGEPAAREKDHPWIYHILLSLQSKNWWLLSQFNSNLCFQKKVAKRIW